MRLKIKDKIIENIPARRITSMGVGGNIRYLTYPKDEEDIYNILDFCKREGIHPYIMGNGTNIIFTDEGFSLLIISTRAMNKIEQHFDIFCGESGALLPVLVAHTSKNGFSGIESLIGIPGSIGGAVIMNAGAYGQEIGEVFQSAIVMKGNNIYEIKKNEVKFSYRYSNLDKMGFILKVCLKLKAGNRDAIRRNMMDAFKQRKKTQPLGYRSAGCIFKNPPNDSAGRIIDMLGLKGKSIGDAEVSTLHANFIVNKGKATSKDIIDLIRFVRDEVYSKTGILLELEVKIVGKEKEIQI